MRKYFLTSLIAFFILPAFASAQDSGQFLINVQGGEDNEPPTEPAILNATPTAATQIDVEWTVSTDNVYLAGYVLLRDLVAIATTTLTSYSDTGLSASTTYSYSVYAFDGFGNVSTTSLAVATTTLALPVVPAATSSTTTRQESTQVLGLRNFSLEANLYGAEITWETTRPSRYVLRWGRTSSYEAGYIDSQIYRNSHSTSIDELEPGTTYLYELIGYDARGFSLKLRSGSFTTKALAFGVPPNVKNLRTILLSDSSVDISYQMPVGYENAKVRIVRSYLGYPRDPYDGAVVFEGVGLSYLDRKVFLYDDTEYYSVFVLGSDGTYSSGAVARVAKFVNAPVKPVTEDGEIITVPIEIEEIKLPDFDFDRKSIQIIQGSEIKTFADSLVELRSDENTLIRIPYEAVPDDLKSIIVTITDPADIDRTYSFLLRINKERTAYEAVLAPLSVTGESLLTVEIFDYEKSVVGRYQKAVRFVQAQQVAEVFFPDKIVNSIKPAVGLGYAALAIFFVVLFFWWRRRQGDNR